MNLFCIFLGGYMILLTIDRLEKWWTGILFCVRIVLSYTLSGLLLHVYMICNWRKKAWNTKLLITFGEPKKNEKHLQIMQSEPKFWAFMQHGLECHLRSTATGALGENHLASLESMEIYGNPLEIYGNPWTNSNSWRFTDGKSSKQTRDFPASFDSRRVHILHHSYTLIIQPWLWKIICFLQIEVNGPSTPWQTVANDQRRSPLVILTYWKWPIEFVDLPTKDGDFP